MNQITITDGRGDLYQWDTGRSVAADFECAQLHFANRLMEPAYVVETVSEDGAWRAAIPEELLQVALPIRVWAVVVDEDGEYTRVERAFRVLPKAKPADYVYTPTDQLTLQAVQGQIGDLFDLNTDAKDTLVDAINEVAAGGGGGGVGYKIGSGLKVERGTLMVDAAEAVERDNTLPITSAAVFVEVGNINALLELI